MLFIELFIADVFLKALKDGSEMFRNIFKKYYMAVFEQYF